MQVNNVSESSMQSLSTATTSDFFPGNPTEHSFGKFQAQTQSDMKRIDSLGSIRTVGKNHQPGTPGQRLPSGGDGAQGAPPTGLGYPRATQLSGAATPLELSQSRPRISPVEARIASIKRHASTSTENAVIHAIEIKPGVGPSSVFTVQQPVDRRVSQHASFDTADEKNDYFDGYRAGSAGDAPKETRSAAYLNGYCDGLIKSRTNLSKRSLSTVSLKSYENATPTQTAKPKATVDPRLPVNRSDVSLQSLPRRTENLRTSSISARGTPYKAWNPPSFISSPILTSTRNNGFEQRVLSGNLHAFDIPSPPASDPLATSYVSVSNEAIVKPQPRRHYEIPISTNTRSILTERSSNTDERIQLGPKWVATDQGLLRQEDYEGLRLKKPSSASSKPQIDSGHGISLSYGSYDGTMEDLKEMIEPGYGKFPSRPAESSGNPQPTASVPAESSRTSRSLARAEPPVKQAAADPLRTTTVTRIAASPDNAPPEPARCSPRRISPRKMAQTFLSRGRSTAQSDVDDRSQQPKSPSPNPDARRGTREKEKWVEKWKKNLNNIRTDEIKEIREYERTHPLPK